MQAPFPQSPPRSCSRRAHTAEDFPAAVAGVESRAGLVRGSASVAPPRPHGAGSRRVVHGQDLGCCCLCLSGVEPAGGGGDAALRGMSPEADVARAEGAILATTEMAPLPQALPAPALLSTAEYSRENFGFLGPSLNKSFVYLRSPAAGGLGCSGHPPPRLALAPGSHQRLLQAGWWGALVLTVRGFCEFTCGCSKFGAVWSPLQVGVYHRHWHFSSCSASSG